MKRSIRKAVSLRRQVPQALLAATMAVLMPLLSTPLLADAERPAAGKRVIYLTVTEECENCARQQRAFRAAADQAGLDYSVRINNFDPAVQAAQVDQALAENPDGIVLWPADASAIVPSLRKITRAGIPLHLTNSMPDERHARFWNSYSGPDDFMIGYNAGKAMIQGFQEKGYGDTGAVIIINGVPGTPPQIKRTEGFTQALQELAPGLRIVGSQPGNWDQTQATEAAAALFTQHGAAVKGVFAQADNMAAGVIVAARRAGIAPSSLVLVGADCMPEGVNAMKRGDQYATVLSSMLLDGRYAAESIVAHLSGQEVPAVRHLEHPIITRDNTQLCDSAISGE